MRKITKEQFLSDVMHEIEMLKIYATITEKSKLNFDALDSSDTNNCIYGQMTGSCKTQRASELIGLCCKRVIKNEGDLDDFSSILPVVNGEFNKAHFGKGRRELNYLSALEGYIMASEARNENVISYIKGKTRTLIL